MPKKTVNELCKLLADSSDETKINLDPKKKNLKVLIFSFLYLYGCNFWEFELGICLSSWIYLFDINVTENYTANISWNVMAFAEAIFDPNKSLVEIVEIEEELLILNESVEKEIDLAVKEGRFDRDA